MLEHIRGRVSEWLAQVDRVPPADLIEQLLPATAYAYELRGPRRQQAWENLKKMRGLVRRIQNRGYATLARIADHIDSLTAGDESNAVIEALDAVNLMTVHASKGLEFPIVFVVNLARGASGPPRPVRVIVDGEGGEPSVSVGPFVSETDEAERDREKQETRRLMYVALTRARDRLYLSSVLKDGVLQPGRGSLAEVLPESLKQLFGRAATAFDEFAVLGWAGQSGRPFEWRICRVPEAVVPVAGPELQVAGAPAGRHAFRPDRARVDAECAGQCDVSVTEWLTQSPAVPYGGLTPGLTGPGVRPRTLSYTLWRRHDRAAGIRDLTAGTLVHRLFQFGIVPRSGPDDERAAHARTLLKPDERAALDDVEGDRGGRRGCVALDAHARGRRRRSWRAAAASTKCRFRCWSETASAPQAGRKWADGPSRHDRLPDSPRGRVGRRRRIQIRSAAGLPSEAARPLRRGRPRPVPRRPASTDGCIYPDNPRPAP